MIGFLGSLHLVIPISSVPCSFLNSHLYLDFTSFAFKKIHLSKDIRLFANISCWKRHLNNKYNLFYYYFFFLLKLYTTCIFSKHQLARKAGLKSLMSRRLETSAVGDEAIYIHTNTTKPVSPVQSQYEQLKSDF